MPFDLVGWFLSHARCAVRLRQTRTTTITASP